MKKTGLILVILLIIAIIGSGCEIKRSEEELREEIKAELEAEQAAEAIAKEEAAKEAAKNAEEQQANQVLNIQNDKTLKIMTERLNVRRDPVLDSAKVGSITNSKTYEYTDEEVRNDGYKWYKVMYEPDTEGWIAGWYTLKNSEFNEHIGRGNLLNAFDGKLDRMSHSIGANISAYEIVNGEADAIINNNVGDLYKYQSLNIFTYGDIGGNIEIGDIEYVTYTGAEEMFGIKIGMTKEEVIGILGEADATELDVTDEVNNKYMNNNLDTYYTGSYHVTLVYSLQNILEQIEISASN